MQFKRKQQTKQGINIFKHLKLFSTHVKFGLTKIMIDAFFQYFISALSEKRSLRFSRDRRLYKGTNLICTSVFERGHFTDTGVSIHVSMFIVIYCISMSKYACIWCAGRSMYSFELNICIYHSLNVCYDLYLYWGSLVGIKWK